MYDEEAMQREAERRVSLEQSIYWLKAVVYQAFRVLQASKQPVKHINSANSNTTSRMEEYFFLIACRKAHRWLYGLKLTTPEAVRFMQLEESTKQVRDNREHDEERYGVGSTRKEPMQKVDADTQTNLAVSSSATVASGSNYLLGGIVDLSVAVNAAEGLLPSLIAEYNEYWNCRTQDPAVAESYHIEPRF